MPRLYLSALLPQAYNNYLRHQGSKASTSSNPPHRTAPHRTALLPHTTTQRNATQPQPLLTLFIHPISSSHLHFNCFFFCVSTFISLSIPFILLITLIVCLSTSSITARSSSWIQSSESPLTPSSQGPLLSSLSASFLAHRQPFGLVISSCALLCLLASRSPSWLLAARARACACLCLVPCWCRAWTIKRRSNWDLMAVGQRGSERLDDWTSNFQHR